MLALSQAQVSHNDARERAWECCRYVELSYCHGKDNAEMLLTDLECCKAFKCLADLHAILGWVDDGVKEDRALQVTPRSSERPRFRLPCRKEKCNASNTGSVCAVVGRVARKFGADSHILDNKTPPMRALSRRSRCVVPPSGARDERRVTTATQPPFRSEHTLGCR